MEIDRNVKQGNTASKRIGFCLDQLEKANDFSKGISFDTEIVKNLSVEELIGALVSAEQQLNQNYD